MKNISIASLSAIALLGLCATAANAGAHLAFSPASTKFGLAGSMSYFGPTGDFSQCTVKLTGSTNAKGGATITRFDLGGSKACKSIVASGLPWKLAPTGPINAVISNATLLSTQLGNCGPGEFDIGVETGGANWTVAANMGACGISFAGAVTPPIRIVTR